MAFVRERIQLPPGHSFRVLRWRNNLRDVELILSPHRREPLGGEGTHWHYHQALELTLFSTGEGTRFVGDNIAPFQRGDLVLLGENLPHYWLARGPSSGISVQWDFPVNHPFWAFPETRALAALFRSAGRGIHFRGRAAETLAAQLHDLAGREGLDRLGQLCRLLAAAAAAAAAEQTFLSARSFSLSDESRHQGAMQAAIRFLLAEFRSEVRLPQLLRVTGMSKPTFSRQFKRHSGKTLSQFLQEIRLDSARRELVETDHAVIDVALGNGFSQISFFNRFFRRQLHCSPSQYRRRQRAARNAVTRSTQRARPAA